jgi:hypothetical protein
VDILNIEVARISVAGRKRSVSPEKVADIQRSIAQQGLMQPIGVRADGDGYQLVFGAHRLSAFQEDGATEIPALVFPAAMTDDECSLAEIQENLARNDLTGAERKAFAAEVGRLIAKIAADCQGEDFANGNDVGDGNWVGEMAKATGTPTKTLYNWWKAFCQDTNRSITPKQATTEDKSAFFDWLEQAKAKAEAEKAEKARKAEEDKQRKEAEAKTKRLAEERSALMDYLDDTARMFDSKIVKEWLYQWIEAQEDAAA